MKCLRYITTNVNHRQQLSRRFRESISNGNQRVRMVCPCSGELLWQCNGNSWELLGTLWEICQWRFVAVYVWAMLLTVEFCEKKIQLLLGQSGIALNKKNSGQRLLHGPGTTFLIMAIWSDLAIFQQENNILHNILHVRVDGISKIHRK